MVICYGRIAKKNQGGLNILVSNPRHILINNMKVSEILSFEKIKGVDYTIK